MVVFSLIFTNFQTLAQDDFSDESEAKTLSVISGVVTDASSGNPIAGANVVGRGRRNW